MLGRQSHIANKKVPAGRLWRLVVVAREFDAERQVNRPTALSRGKRGIQTLEVKTHIKSTRTVQVLGVWKLCSSSLNHPTVGDSRCAVITSIPSGGVGEFQCNGMDGRYVNVVIPREEYLTLCEVEVYGSSLD
ncbi:hypothetical protein VZT92_027802 [Zoarces viviparus]|uniref:Uncharacterized protein n=1 Tax=Zoarces viviparus TaxID=48416 RepID=A0AAW1DVB3_ZOAVI